MLKVALIGASGHISKRHITAYQQLKEENIAEIVACCDIHPDNIELKNTRIYTDYNNLIEKEKNNLDIVDICVPTFLHKDFSIKAMEAGINVLCEKPMALNYEDCLAMVDTSKRTGKKLMIAQVLRFTHDFEVIHDYVKNEKLGKFISASVSGYGKGLPQGQDGWFKKAELSGGPIFDVHTHMADALMWFFGKPESISSIGNYNDRTRYTAITSNIAYSNGTFVNSIGNWSVASRKHNPGRTLRLDFENGYIIKDNLQFVEVDREDNVKDLTNPETQNPFVKEIRYFAECVANNKAVSVCPPEETAEVIRYILTEIKSADNKGEKILF